MVGQKPVLPHRRLPTVYIPYIDNVVCTEYLPWVTDNGHAYVKIYKNKYNVNT
jgi:hypothetical protein